MTKIGLNATAKSATGLSRDAEPWIFVRPSTSRCHREPVILLMDMWRLVESIHRISRLRRAAAFPDKESSES